MHKVPFKNISIHIQIKDSANPVSIAIMYIAIALGLRYIATYTVFMKDPLIWILFENQSNKILINQNI